jgi:hypothetical protein
MKCDSCGEEITSGCTWRQGRCPHRPPMLSEYHFRYCNLIEFIKHLFKRG